MNCEIHYNIITWDDQTPVPEIGNYPQSWQRRLNNHRQPKHKRQAIMAYDLLYQMVVKQLGYAPEIETAEQGKPYFMGCDIYFSLSHTQNGAMVALGGVEIGCDLEKIRPVSVRMMDRVANTVDVEVFFQTWVQREAVGKCLATGITATGQVLGDTTEIAVELVAAPSGYTAAVAQA